VFGHFDGMLLKMVSVNKNGKFIECRYTQLISTIRDLTKKIWKKAKRGGKYTVNSVSVKRVFCTKKDTVFAYSKEPFSLPVTSFNLAAKTPCLNPKFYTRDNDQLFFPGEKAD
jgi:hypothetical protein